MGFAWVVKNKWNGRIKNSKKALLSIIGIDRKVLSLIFQNGKFSKPDFHGPVVDSNVFKVVTGKGPHFNWSKAKTKKGVAQDLERHLNPRHSEMLNELCAGLRQAWSKKENRETMVEVAEEKGAFDLLCEIVADKLTDKGPAKKMAKKASSSKKRKQTPSQPPKASSKKRKV